MAVASPGEAHSMRVADVGSSDQGPDMVLKVLEGTLIGGSLSPKTDSFIHSQLAQQSSSNPTDTLNLLTALLLGSPEFQLR